MAVIRPFRALRPTKGHENNVASLPYDVYSREEAYQKVQGHPEAFLNIDCPETQFGPEQDMYAPEVYAKADEMLRKMEQDGLFVQDAVPCYYLYELTMNGRSQTGLVAASSVDDYRNSVIKKHENTRKEKEMDRINHVNTCSAQTGPIFLAYRGDEKIRAIIKACKEKPVEADFIADDGIRHRTWVIDEPKTIEALTAAFGKLNNTYIADGHHRAASAVAVSGLRREAHPAYTGEEEFNYFLSVLFDDAELMIMDYNRVLKDLNGNSPKELLEKLCRVFSVKEAGREAYHPAAKGEVGLFLADTWYCLNAKPELMSTDPVDGLDVAFLQREVLEPIFGISDPTTDKRIDFVGGIRGLSELERRCNEDCSAAFAMYPTSITELLAVADADRLMPPKSTWFEPKLRSGLFIHKIER